MNSTENQEINCAAGGSSRDGNTFVAPFAPVDWPAETGPFVYMPDPLAVH